MPISPLIAGSAWLEHEVERAESMVRKEFPDVRPDLIGVALRLAQRDVSPRDGLGSLVALVRQTLERRQMLVDQA